LSTYKNQEYPEKLLQIKNLQKEVLDLHNVHAEEKDELVDMISKETNRLHNIQIELEKSMVKSIFEVKMIKIYVNISYFNSIIFLDFFIEIK
jgi:hypothetical protein